MQTALSSENAGLILKIGLFIILALLGVMLFPPLLISMGGYLIAASLGTFAAAAIANTAVLRIFERARLADIGLNWHEGASRNLLIGIATGVTGVLVVLMPPLLFGAASMERTPDQPGSLSSAVFVTVVLLFGAVGEEMLFRGYGFQLLFANIGRFGTILPASVL